MDASIVVAVVALVGAALSAAIALYGQLHSETLKTKRDAEAVLREFREPLLGAAYELQSRLYNIVELEFLDRYYRDGDDAQREYAVQNTLYVIGQYFAWSEILRRKIQFLNFSDTKRTREVNRCQRAVVKEFQSDDEGLGRQLLIWRGEQRAIGELMIDPDTDPPQCVGYARFLERDEPELRRWFGRLEGDLDALSKQGLNPRLTHLQNALVDLINQLDPDHLRYAEKDIGKLPLPPALTPGPNSSSI